MSPSYVLRAMPPLQSSLVRSTTTSAATSASSYFCRPSLISRRLISSTSTPASEQPQPGQSIPQPSTALPSLRNYPYTLKTGTVVSVGRMDRTVRVDHRHTIWDRFLRKSYPKVTSYLVADPQNSLREGDVIEFSSGFPKSRQVRHVVERIIAPFGEAIADRPAVMSRDERDAVRAEKRAAKAARREQRRAENGAPELEYGHGQEHVGRIRRLILERTAAAAASVQSSA